MKIWKFTFLVYLEWVVSKMKKYLQFHLILNLFQFPVWIEIFWISKLFHLVLVENCRELHDVHFSEIFSTKQFRVSSPPPISMDGEVSKVYNNENHFFHIRWIPFRLFACKSCWSLHKHFILNCSYSRLLLAIIWLLRYKFHLNVCERWVEDAANKHRNSDKKKLIYFCMWANFNSRCCWFSSSSAYLSKISFKLVLMIRIDSNATTQAWMNVKKLKSGGFKWKAQHFKNFNDLSIFTLQTTSLHCCREIRCRSTLKLETFSNQFRCKNYIIIFFPLSTVEHLISIDKFRIINFFHSQILHFFTLLYGDLALHIL